MTLRELKIGESAVIASVGGEGALRQHFLDMGLLPGVEVKLLKFAPMGDPMELLVRGYTLSLRLEEASQITVDAPDGSQQPERVKHCYILLYIAFALQTFLTLKHRSGGEVHLGGKFLGGEA